MFPMSTLVSSAEIYFEGRLGRVKLTSPILKSGFLDKTTPPPKKVTVSVNGGGFHRKH